MGQETVQEKRLVYFKNPRFISPIKVGASTQLATRHISLSFGPVLEILPQRTLTRAAKETIEKFRAKLSASCQNRLRPPTVFGRGFNKTFSPENDPLPTSPSRSIMVIWFK